MISYYSNREARRTDSKRWYIRNRVAMLHVRWAYRQMRGAGMNRYTARHLVLSLISAGMFYGELR